VGAALSRRAVLARVVLAAAIALFVFDLTRAPAVQWSARLELGAIAAYRRALSPQLGDAGLRCRFTPSCSRYAEQAIRRHGAVGGTARAVWRIARCGPWTPAGTHDPLR
jgi:uncharacterized protein